MSVVVYVLGLVMYAWVGGALTAPAFILTMDSGMTRGSWLYIIVIALLWVTGLVFGTMAYF